MQHLSTGVAGPVQRIVVPRPAPDGAAGLELADVVPEPSHPEADAVSEAGQVDGHGAGHHPGRWGSG